jgi:hypothetical protein
MRASRQPFLPWFAACLLATLPLSAAAQQAITPAPPDLTIVAPLRQVSTQPIQADIAKLVTFGNRSTLSSMDTDLPPGTGVLAASDWVFAEFNRISAACGNCLEVKRDDFIEPPQAGTPTAPARIVRPTRIVNIYAVLRGSDPAQAARRVLVTGHYDSRITDVMNSHDPAPGANDDASGVAVSLECARVLTQSHIKFPASLVFVAVAGEEQGLNGSAHLARLAKSEGWDLEAVLNNDIVGGDTTPGQEALQDKSAVRVFSEGVPGAATLDQLHQIQSAGAESDSPSRELARAVLDVASTSAPPGSPPPSSPAPHTACPPRSSPPSTRCSSSAATASCAAATTPASTWKALPPSASPSGAKTSPTSTRTSASSPARSSETSCNSSIPSTSPTSPA